ncbi:MAG: PilZ domain-containing protein [Bacillota bacterium]
MEEKRRNKRLPVNITLTVEELYNQKDKIEDINDEILVVNISKGGIAFEVEDDLPLNYYFNARITIDDKKSFFSVIKIIRKEKINKGYYYGCEFVGLADVLGTFVDDYEKEINKC